MEYEGYLVHVQQSGIYNLYKRKSLSAAKRTANIFARSNIPSNVRIIRLPDMKEMMSLIRLPTQPD